MSGGGFGPAEAAALLDAVFADWVRALGLEAVALGPGEARFRVPANDALALRGGPGAGVVCGQAVAALADTAAVLALAGANGRFRNCTTVTLTVSYLRPLRLGPLAVEVTVPANGRTLATCEVTLRGEADAKPAARASVTFLYLEA